MVRKIVTGPPATQSIFVPASAGLQQPSGLVRGPDGILYVAGASDDTVKRFNATTGQSLGTFATGAQLPIGITFGPDGHLYTASRDGTGVMRYNGTTGAFMGRFATASTEILWWAYDLAFGPQGDLFVTSFERGRVLRFNGTTGALIGTFVSVSGTATSGLAFAPNGDLYLAGFGNGRIYRFSGTGQALGNFNTGQTELSDIVYGPDGFLYASFNRKSFLYKLHPLTGALLATYPTGTGVNSGSSSLIVFAPEIAVYNGNLTAAQLSDGQTAAVDFLTTIQPTPVTKTITVANPGNQPLVISNITVPPGYSFVTPPPLPATIAANGSLALLIRLNAATAGTFAGSVGIASNDPDEAVFDFPVTGRVVTPDIVLHNGTTAAAPELNDGQEAPVDFGRNIQGTPGTRSFTLANTGTAALLVSSVTVPPGYTALNLPALPLTVGLNQSTTFQISLTTLTAGIHAGSVMITSDDLDEAAFDFPVTGEVFIPDPVSSVVSTTTTLNRQTGLREQTIHITNDTTATVPAYNLIIRGLPAGVEVNNASETRADGSFVVYIRQGMNPHSVQDIVIEYYSPTRAPLEINPQLSTEVVLNPPDLTVPAGGEGLAVENLTRLPGGEMLLQFTTTPGRRYEVQYSRDGQSWQVSQPAIRAVANRTQWLDRGLPRTDSHPSAHASRFYRVVETAP